ncbi:MAG: DUF3857 domain-containing transglutaminase family protein [Bacteroidales bacterium]|nr:MAG: DUF3857 domain-containing transglutaminase family protein [Bacteroidales bacterium]
MKYILSLFFILVSTVIFAQGNLSVGLIADSLKKNSDAVVRFMNTEYIFVSETKMLRKEHYAITVLNKNGVDIANLLVFYDNDIKVKRIEGNLYNSEGVKILELKKSDIGDYSAFESFTLYSDSRVKTASPIFNKYPYTVEYKYELEQSGNSIPSSWSPIDYTRQAVQNAKLTLSNFGTRVLFREQNLKCNNSSMENGQYQWVVEGVKSLDYEPYSVHNRNLVPKVYFSTLSSMFYGYQADFSTWDKYGKLVYRLIEGRDALPLETVSLIKSITDSVDSEIDKVKKVYDYVQRKVRYVNISKGIGGFQPIEANLVDKYSYGDCKALSNYTRALLKSVGIKSYYTEIGSGDDVSIKFHDFASLDQTNHVILVVPLKSDTVWLECTDNKMPFGYIGSGNSNRFALAVTEDGGKLLKTPSYSESTNVTKTLVKSVIVESGDMSLVVESASYNEMFDYMRGFEYQSKQEQEKSIYSGIQLNGLKLKNFSFANESSYKNVKGVLKYEADVLQYASIAGNRLMFKPNILNKHQFRFNKPDRKNDLDFESGYTTVDSINIAIPSGYKLEFEFQKNQFKAEVGEYESRMEKIDDGNLLYIRKLVVKGGVYSKEKYAEISDFFKKVSLSDNKSCVLIKT